jgi:hypothetical protein
MKTSLDDAGYDGGGNDGVIGRGLLRSKLESAESFSSPSLIT